MFRKLRMCALVALLLVSSFSLANEPAVAPTPEAGKALVVFVRPAWRGSAFGASIYEAPDDRTQIIGFIQSGQRLAYQAEPGVHRFMVIGENADFMDATLEAGKTYYVVAAVRPGFFASRFSLWPMRTDPNAGDWSIHGAQFKEWMAKTEFVPLSPDSSQRWYDMNKAMVDKKKAGFLKKWNVMDAPDRAELTLNAEDGV